MAKQKRSIPEGYHSITPILVLRGASEAIEFYKRAFDATVTSRMDRPDGKLMHAAMKFGDSLIMLGEECQPHEGHEQNCTRSPSDLQGTTISLYFYVKAVDEVFEQAVKAGARAVMPVTDMFWGDRAGMLMDPYGHSWFIATHIEDLTVQQMKERMEESAKS